MDENIFFDVCRLKRRGKNVIIGRTVRIRYPELVELSDNVILDDFTYISTQLTIASNVHIASGCKLIGGPKASISFEPFSTLAPGAVLAAGSDDYRAGLATPLVPDRFKGAPRVGHIAIGRHSIVGANAVVLPGVTFGEGSALGALSLARTSLESWTLHAGTPARKIGDRDRAAILALEKTFLAQARE